LSRALRWLFAGLVGAFLGLFLVLPMASLLLVGFTGEPVDLLGHLVRADLSGLAGQLADQADWRYYACFFETRRYFRGFLNAVGAAPLAAVLAWGTARLVLGLWGALGGTVPERIRRGAGLPLMTLVFGAVLLAGVSWRLVVPTEAQQGHWMYDLAPSRSWDGRLWQILGFCPLVTLAATFLGGIVAWSVARTAMPGRNLVRWLCILPLALPPFLGALAFRNLLGEGGLLTRILEAVGLGTPFPGQSVLAAGIVQTFLFFPFVVLTTAAALERMDPSLGEAAEVTGARPGFSLWTVHLPMLMPGLSAGAFLAFIRSFGDFAVLSLLMPIGRPILVVEAYRDLAGSTDWGGASMLSTVMVLTILAVLALQKSFAEGGGFETVTGRGAGESGLVRTPWVCRACLAACAAILSVPVLFVAATLLVSLSARWGVETLPTAYTLSRYGEILRRLVAADSPLLNSFALVLPALGLALVLALAVAWTLARSRHWTRNLLDFATVLPFVVPGVAFAVALIGIFNGPPLALHLTATLVLCAYVVTRMPYAVRSILASLQQVGPSLEEGSKTLGATSSLTMARVTIPLILPGFTAGAIMVFISAMQDVAITLMVCPPRWYPASIFVFQRIQEGDVFDASAYGMVLLGLIMVPYALAWRLGGVRAGL